MSFTGWRVGPGNAEIAKAACGSRPLRVAEIVLVRNVRGAARNYQDKGLQCATHITNRSRTPDCTKLQEGCRKAALA